jgi:hypothetical protein
MPTPLYVTVPAGTRPARCRGCAAAIYWVLLPSDTRAPISCTADDQCHPPTAREDGTGLIHFADCPAGDRFRKASRMVPGRRHP